MLKNSKSASRGPRLNISCTWGTEQTIKWRNRVLLVLTCLILFGFESIHAETKQAKVNLPQDQTALPYKLPLSQLENRYKRLDDGTKRKIQKRLDNYMEKLAATYVAQDQKNHEKWTLELLWYASRLPVYFLESYHNEFIAKIKNHGIAPFLSYYLDYGVRLLNSRSASSIRKFKRLKGLYNPKKESDDKDATVYLRTEARSGFVRYSQSVGWAAATFAFSNIGENYSRIGSFASGNFLKALGLIDWCRTEEEKERKKNATTSPQVRDSLSLHRVDMCAALAEGVQDAFELEGSDLAYDDFADALDGLGQGGFLSSQKDCLTDLGNDTIARLVGRVEDYMACRHAENSDVNPSLERLISMLPYDSGFYSIQHPGEGKTGVGLDVPNEFGGTSRTEYRKFVVFEAGKTQALGVEYRHKETDANGNPLYESQEFVGTTTKNENVTYSREREVNPATGSITTTESTSMEGVGSVSTQTTVDKDGNFVEQKTSVTIEFDDGSTTTWTTTKNKDGNVKTTVTSTEATEAAAQPIDDVVVDECASAFHERPNKGRDISKIETQIIPAVDSAPDDSIITECLVGTGSQTNHCTSVWLCLDGEVDDDCRCKKGAELVGAPPYAEVCQLIVCTDGATCDPSTGTCRSVEGDVSSAEPPIPMPFSELAERVFGKDTASSLRMNANAVQSMEKLQDFRLKAIHEQECGAFAMTCQ